MVRKLFPFLIGNDDFLHDLFVRKFCKQYNIKDRYPLDLKDISLEDVLFQLGNSGLFSQSLLWILKVTNKNQLPKVGKISEKCKDISIFLLFSCVSEEYWKILKEAKLLDHIKVLELTMLNTLEFQKWVLEKLKPFRLKMTQQALCSLEHYYHSEGKLSAVNDLLEKVILFFPADRVINHNDLKDFFTYLLKPDLYQLYSCLEQFDIAKLLSLKERLVNAGINEQKVLSQLIWQVLKKKELIKEDLLFLEGLWKQGKINIRYLLDLYILALGDRIKLSSATAESLI